jgi:hypothetical protein
VNEFVLDLNLYHSTFFLFFIRQGLAYVAQAGLELAILLPWSLMLRFLLGTTMLVDAIKLLR